MMMTVLLIVIFISFIGVGLPDSILGTAWPSIYREFDLPVSLAGYITATVSACTIISSLLSAKVISRFGTGMVTAVSTTLTVVALFGFAFTGSAIFFFVMAIPLGLGAGSIDTALNNFVALHYSATKMNFLHCFYGLGIAASPYIMSYALGNENNWRKGYILVAFIQSVIALIAIFSLPLWKNVERQEKKADNDVKVLKLSELIKMPAVRLSCYAFFSSCALELTAGSWSSTYFVNTKGVIPDKAAQITMLFYVGLAFGRFLSGVLAKILSRWQIIGISTGVLLGAIIMFILPVSIMATSIALFFIGLGIGPIFPNLTHLTPENFGRDISQSVMGVQQASAYIGIMIMPWLFGTLAQICSTKIFPCYLLIMFLVYMITLVMLNRKIKRDALSKEENKQ
ncbi:MAG: MFS transporter [Lachnospiraceae bacterium]|nr:MFS transporter [Lachnospiraceae bacterium]